MADKNDVSTVGLLRSIGLVRSISLMIGGIIGSGIFASPRMVLINSGSVGMALLVWFLCGILSLGATLCMLELALMIPKSGADYAYIHEAFGPLPAFLFSFITICVISPSKCALISLTCSEYIVTAVFGTQCVNIDKTLLAKLIAFTVLGIILLVNCAYTRWATSLHVVFTALKLSAIAVIIMTGIVKMFQGNTSAFENSFEGTSASDLPQIGTAFYAGLWAYNGWNSLCYMTEEIKSPNKVIPRASYIAVAVVTISYLLMNIAYMATLTVAEIKSSNAVAVLLANKIYGPMAWFVPLFVSFSTFGTCISTLMVSGRVVYVTARDGNFMTAFAFVHNKRHTPMIALFLPFLLATIMLVPESSNFSSLISYFGFTTWLFYGIDILALLWLRYKEPKRNRPYKVFIGIPFLVLLFVAYLVFSPFKTNPVESIICLVLIVLGIPIYLIFIKWKLTPKPISDVIDSLTYKLQICGNFSIENMNSEKLEYKDTGEKTNEEFLASQEKLNTF